MSSIIGNFPEEFESFGPSLITDRAMGEPTTVDLPSVAAEFRPTLRRECPTTPGIYGWLNQDRQLIYVGKSKALRHRLLSYFAKTPSDPKMLRIRQQSSQIVWEPIAHELLALLREQELIHRWQPQFNSQGQPTRRQPAFVCLSDSPAPHAFVAKRLPKNASAVFGPIMGTTQLNDSVEALNHQFQLRDCSDKTKFEFTDQLVLFAETVRAQCIRHELGSCPAPCARTCSPATYRSNVERAVAFLNGSDTTTLPHLERQMSDAAARFHFERAAVLRNQWQALSRLDRQLGRLKRLETVINGIMACPVSRSRRLWTVFRGGRLAATILEPRSARQAAEAAEALTNIHRQPVEASGNILDINLQLIVASWFKKNRDDIQRLVPTNEMAEACLIKAKGYSRSA